MTEQSIKFAFIVRDGRAQLDSLIYAEYDGTTLDIRSSQKINDYRYLLIPYVISNYAERMSLGLTEDIITFSEEDTELASAYRQFRKGGKKVSGVVRNLDCMVNHFHQYLPRGKLKVPHSLLSTEPVPDFEHMTLEKFTAWITYFLEGMKKEG